MRNRFYLLSLILALCVFFAGCSNIHVSGSGKVGPVTGGGGVDIPIPQK